MANGEIILLYTDIGKLRHCRKFLASQICVLTLFGKIKFSGKFPNLKYSLVEMAYVVSTH